MYRSSTLVVPTGSGRLSSIANSSTNSPSWLTASFTRDREMWLPVFSISNATFANWIGSAFPTISIDWTVTGATGSGVAAGTTTGTLSTSGSGVGSGTTLTDISSKEAVASVSASVNSTETRYSPTGNALGSHNSKGVVSPIYTEPIATSLVATSAPLESCNVTFPAGRTRIFPVFSTGVLSTVCPC